MHFILCKLYLSSVYFKNIIYKSDTCACVGCRTPLPSKPCYLVNSRIKAFWENHSFDPNTGNLPLPAGGGFSERKSLRGHRGLFWIIPGKQTRWWAWKEVAQESPIMFSLGDKPLHSSLAQPSLVLHLSWFGHKHRWCEGTMTKGDALQDWPAHQAGIRDAGGATCLKKRNSLKILTASESGRHHGLTYNSNNCEW